MANADTPRQSNSKPSADNQSQRLSAALEAAQIGVFEIDAKKNVGNWDLNMRKIWGIPDDEEITYETLIAGIHADDVAVFDRARANTRDPNGDGIMDMEYRITPRNGGPMRWVHVVAKCSFEGGVPAFILGTVRDVTEKRKLAEQNQLLVNELQHRVKNTLATVMSVIRLSKPEDNDIEKYILALEERLLSMSQTHSLVNRSDGKSIDIKTIIEKEFLAYDGPKTKLYDLQGPSLFIPPAHVRIISMAIHELVTNACKHGALRAADGHVTITTALDTGVARFKWAEKSEVPTPAPTQTAQISETPSGGFGSFLLSKVVAAELQGTATYEINSEGLMFDLNFPLKEAQ